MKSQTKQQWLREEKQIHHSVRRHDSQIVFSFSFFSATPFTQGNTTVNAGSVNRHTTATTTKKRSSWRTVHGQRGRQAHVTVGSGNSSLPELSSVGPARSGVRVRRGQGDGRKGKAERVHISFFSFFFGSTAKTLLTPHTGRSQPCRGQGWRRD